MKRLLPPFPLLAFTIGFLCRPLNLAQASVIEVDISSLVNADLTAYTGGTNYPQHGGALIVAGVSFKLATLGHNADTAIIQSSTSSGVAETFSIATGVFGVTSAYTLINSAFGTCGGGVGELDFIGTLSTFTYTLTEGVNIRDHFNGNFCNVVTGVAGTASFGAGADRLDMQQIDLPTVFANEMLQRIDFKSFGRGANGSPFLAAATLVTSAIPEPPTWSTAAVIGFILLLVKR